MSLVGKLNNWYENLAKDSLKLMKELEIPKDYRKEVVEKMSTIYRKATLSLFFLRNELQEYLNSELGYFQVMKNLEKITGITFSSQLS